WFFTPQQDKDRNPTRVGVRLEELNAEQKAAALELLRTGLSERGFGQAVTIMSLEGVLNDLEGPKGAMGRNTGWYFLTVFGDAAAGIAADKLNPDQQKTLRALLTEYVDRLPEDLAAEEMKKVTGATPDKLVFAYSGSPEPGQGYTYRVYGPGFVVEFLNIQAD